MLCYSPAILSAPSFELLRGYMDACRIKLVYRKDIDKFF